MTNSAERALIEKEKRKEMREERGETIISKTNHQKSSLGDENTAKLYKLINILLTHCYHAADILITL
jgi:phosphoribosyl-ATP pyrophosphohydrolase